MSDRIELGFPHDLERRAIVHGTTFDLVDDDRRHVWTEFESAPLAIPD
jgi:hypothetical protein